MTADCSRRCHQRKTIFSAERNDHAQLDDVGIDLDGPSSRKMREAPEPKRCAADRLDNFRLFDLGGSYAKRVCSSRRFIGPRRQIGERQQLVDSTHRVGVPSKRDRSGRSTTLESRRDHHRENARGRSSTRAYSGSPRRSSTCPGPRQDWLRATDAVNQREAYRVACLFPRAATACRLSGRRDCGGTIG
jgi:hypothetical protein